MKDLMNYDAFTVSVKEAFEERYPDKKVELHHVLKNNGVELVGISAQSSGCSITPSLYLEEFYDRYKEGENVNMIICDILQLFEQASVIPQFDVGSFSNFEQMRPKICFRLCNIDANRELLKSIPYREYMDLAITYVLRISSEASIRITNNITQIWSITEEELFEIAKENTPRLEPPTVQTIMEVLTGMVPGFGTDADDSLGMYVVTNEERMNGSCTMLYPDVCKSFADKHGSFYILPSSIHEVLFLKDTGEIEPDYLMQMVQEINQAEVAPQDVLSNNVYHYDCTAGLLEIVG